MRMSTVAWLGIFSVWIAVTSCGPKEEGSLSGDDTSSDGGDGGDGGDDDGDGDGDGGDGGDGGTTEDLEDIGGDTFEEATVIDIGSEYSFISDPIASDAINNAYDRDFFSFVLDEGDMVILATAAYYRDKDTEPDTVLRLYDDAGNLLYTNDDMPFRYWETDSMIYFQATYSGSYVAEVLEYSDWDPDTTFGLGGNTFTYDLLGIAFPAFDYEPDDTIKEADQLAESDKDGLISLMFSPYFTDSAGEFFGVMSKPDDLDLWLFEFSDYWNYSFNFWPGPSGNLSPQLALYDEEMNLLAFTTSPIIDTTEYYAYYDHGLLYPVEPKKKYYVGVSDVNGTEGAGTFYPAMHTGYLRKGSVSVDEVEPNDTTGAPMQLDGIELDDLPGYYYSYFQGNLEGNGVDDADTFVFITPDGLQDQYVTVIIHAEGLGSLLDARITIYDQDGETIIEETETNNRYGGADPMLYDIPVGPDTGYIFVKVEPELAGDHPESNKYFGRIVSYYKPVFE